MGRRPTAVNSRGPSVVAGRRQPVPDGGLSTARILLVDGDLHRRFLSRQWLEIAGAPEPETAETGDEALDVLGAAAQQFDLVAFWLPLRDAAAVDLVGVLRRNRSPVRLLAVTSGHIDDVPLKGRLAGIAAVDDTGTPRGFVQQVRTMLATAPSVAEILRDKRVPPQLAKSWARAIYGTEPGGVFYADLD